MNGSTAPLTDRGKRKGEKERERQFRSRRKQEKGLREGVGTIDSLPTADPFLPPPTPRFWLFSDGGLSFRKGVVDPCLGLEEMKNFPRVWEYYFSPPIAVREILFLGKEELSCYPYFRSAVWEILLRPIFDSPRRCCTK